MELAAAAHKSHAPDWAALHAAAGTLARRLRAVVSQQAARHGLTEPQFAVLWTCRHTAAGLGQNDLADRLAFSAAQVSTIVEQLRQGGWLAGGRDPADRRRQCWQLTPLGHDLLDKVVKDLSAWSDQRDLPCEPFLADSLAALSRAIEQEHLSPTARVASERGEQNLRLFDHPTLALPPQTEVQR